MKKRYWAICGLCLFAISKLGGTPPVQDQSTISAAYGPTSSTDSVSPTQPAKKAELKRVATLQPPQETKENYVGDSEPETSEVRYISGNRVALRTRAASDAGIIDRFDVGRKVELIEVQNDWSRVRDSLTLKEGWIASRFLKDREPEAKAAEPPKQKPTNIPPAIAPSVIIQRIITESVASYPGSCACPYSTDRRGKRCGNRSAYSKPGGYAPICFAQDVTNSMIEAYR
ncbi:SH3 domain-containing protein [Agrobacterium sp. BA1120]|uniref:SH3 domain-containing protein n=1 Tax=Agrobacterium sp. BA1120 TaxID=3228927 RepID=UPI00336A11B7